MAKLDVVEDRNSAWRHPAKVAAPTRQTPKGIGRSLIVRAFGALLVSVVAILVLMHSSIVGV